MKKQLCLVACLVTFLTAFPVANASADPTSPTPSSGPLPNPPPPPDPDSAAAGNSSSFINALVTWLGVILGR